MEQISSWVQYNPVQTMRSAMGSFVLLLLMLDASAQAGTNVAEIQQKVAALITISPALAAGHLGFEFIDAENGTVLASQNADRFFTPASNTKLYTTALALVRLGQTYRFQTVVRASHALASSDAIPDLTIVGGGDPNLSGRVLPFSQTANDNDPLFCLRQLADRIAGKGIRRIAGNIYGDDTRHPFDPYPDGWSVDDTLWYYGIVTLYGPRDVRLAVSGTRTQPLVHRELVFLGVGCSPAKTVSERTRIMFQRIPPCCVAWR